MKGFLFFLLTISLLIMIQLQPLVLTGSSTPPTKVSTRATAKKATKGAPAATSQGGPPVLSMAEGGYLLLLVNILTHFYLS
ncbi:CAMPATH-1 antigen [Tupaia chinensis]|uniref:CAMPATH-1 antigen n=1 Tax=Tupaia chinensis TaxID=246437 RepID=L9JBB4_TUPCH|nr:CAMPATH-1 antigen [Tupaia chinensis]ELW47653.1 hypothetical protein TREES_T100021899 [Tupaia chinensis]